MLKSDGDIDVILGMDWLTKHKGLISCFPRSVNLEHPSGMRVQVDIELRSEDEKKEYEERSRESESKPAAFRKPRVTGRTEPNSEK